MRVVGLCLWWLLVLATYSGCQDGGTLGASQAGELAPPIKLVSLDHDRFYLQDQRGKPVLLLFWDTSCEICKRQMVEIESLRKTLGPNEVAVAGVLNDPENVDVARRMVDGLGLGFPTLLDRGGKVTQAYGVKGFPTTVVVTPEGRVGFTREGYTAPLMTQLRKTLEQQLRRARHGS